MYRSARATIEFKTETGTISLLVDSIGRGPEEFSGVGAHIGAAIQKTIDEGLLRPAALGSRQVLDLQSKLNETSAKLTAAEQQLSAYTITAQPSEARRDNAPDVSSSVPGVQSVTRKSRRGPDRE